MIISVHFANERVLFKISSFLVEIQNIVRASFGHSQLLESQRNLPYIAPFAIVELRIQNPTYWTAAMLA